MKREANRSGRHCPECNQRTSLNPAKAAQFLTCLHRDTKLAVVGIDPLDFNWVYDWTWEGEDEEQEAEAEKEGAKVVVLGFCPDCDGEIRFDSQAGLGHKLVCPHCDVDLIVISVDPPDLDWAYVQTDRDWGDVEDEDDW